MSNAGAPPGPVNGQWSLGRSVLGARILGSVARACALLLVVVLTFTLLFVAAFGHAAVWIAVGSVFGVLPLLVLAVSLGVRWRAAVATGPGWVGMRVVRRWHTIPVGGVRIMRFEHTADTRRTDSRCHDGSEVIETTSQPTIGPGTDSSPR
jgi:hypothetical protein